MTSSPTELRRRFRDLHASGTFVMPNPWDVGSAKLLVSLGFPALATTSAGLAVSLGTHDQHITFEQVLAHCAAMTAAVDVPINADSERLYADDLDGIATNVERLAATGIAGCSIEDFDPATGEIDSIGIATARVHAAAEAAKATGVVLTARAENHLYGQGDLDDTIARLVAYRDAGAEVVYAPGLVDIDQIARVVREVGVPLNVLALQSAPPVPALEAAGVRRVSTGSGLAMAAYGALASAARAILDQGATTQPLLSSADRNAAYS